MVLGLFRVSGWNSEFGFEVLMRGLGIEALQLSCCDEAYARWLSDLEPLGWQRRNILRLTCGK